MDKANEYNAANRDSIEITALWLTIDADSVGRNVTVLVELPDGTWREALGVKPSPRFTLARARIPPTLQRSEKRHHKRKESDG